MLYLLSTVLLINFRDDDLGATAHVGPWSPTQLSSSPLCSATSSSSVWSPLENFLQDYPVPRQLCGILNNAGFYEVRVLASHPTPSLGTGVSVQSSLLLDQLLSPQLWSLIHPWFHFGVSFSSPLRIQPLSMQGSLWQCLFNGSTSSPCYSNVTRF